MYGCFNNISNVNTSSLLFVCQNLFGTNKIVIYIDKLFFLFIIK